MGQVTAQDLKTEIDDMRERYRNLKDDELFVAWFMKCFVTDTEGEGVTSLVGGSRDKSLHAVHIDEAARKVFIIQGKYRQKVSSGTETRQMKLANALCRYRELAHCARRAR